MKFKPSKPIVIFTTLFLIILLLLYLVYKFIIFDYILERAIAENFPEASSSSSDSIFKLHRIVIYDNALPTTVDDASNLENIDVSLFSDIALFIDNTSQIYELTPQNTVKTLSISDITIQSNNADNSYLDYKNYNDFAIFSPLSDSNKDIHFDILTSNSDNLNNGYTTPVFYTDCSNPITLGFVSKNIVEDYTVSENESTLSYNGKILQESNTDLDSISYVLGFKINITTNANASFTCDVSLNVNLNDEAQSISTNGYRYSNFTVSGEESNFIKN